MDSMVYVVEDDKRKTGYIKGDFSYFDRIYYQNDRYDNQDYLLLFSTKKQSFARLDLNSMKMSALNINKDKEYKQVECYDEKIFCINSESLTMDIFSLSKKRQMYHKQTIHFANKELKLKKEFRLIVWKHHETGILYRCLLGPLEDGRYMNFDLRERYFNNKAKEEEVTVRVVFVSLALEDRSSNPYDVICALDENKKTIMCFDIENQIFFEYNGFSEEDSKIIEVIYAKLIEHNKVRRMYFYYPYNFFTPKEQNQLKAASRNMNMGKNLVDYIKSKYREILLCMEGTSLMKISVLDDAPMMNGRFLWKVSQVKTCDSYSPVDIAINENSGEIYCLCEQEIVILENSGREPVFQEKSKRREEYYTEDYFS